MEENLDFKASGRSAVNEVPGKNSRVSGFQQGERKWLGPEKDVATVGLEWWSHMGEEEARLYNYAVIQMDPEYARRVAYQLLDAALYADGLL